MEKRDFVKKLYAGLFFLIGIALIIIVVIAISIDKGIIQPKFAMKAAFTEVGGLKVGAPIRLSGVNVGVVKAIDFLDKPIQGRRVVVTMNIFNRYRDQVKKATRFAIKTEGILGAKLIEISTNEQAPLLDVNKIVIGEDPMDVQDLAETFGEAAVSLKETSLTIESLIKEMRYSSKTFKRLLDRIEQRIIEGNLFKLF